MFVITTGSQVSKMIEILSIVGEFPFTAIGMLGKRNYIYNQIYKHIHVNDYSVPGAAEIIRCQLFQLSGRGALKTIRFHKSGLQVLEQWNKAAYLSYMNSFDQHFFRSDDEHITRNHRIAESAVMCLNAGIEIRPDQVPQLTKMHHQVLPFDEPVFYLSKHYRETQGHGRRKLLTPDEVLRLPNREMLVVIRGQNVLKLNKFDYTGHPMSRQMIPVSILDYAPGRESYVPAGLDEDDEVPIDIDELGDNQDVINNF